jgi:hypothetical protein
MGEQAAQSAQGAKAIIRGSEPWQTMVDGIDSGTPSESVTLLVTKTKLQTKTKMGSSSRESSTVANMRDTQTQTQTHTQKVTMLRMVPAGGSIAMNVRARVPFYACSRSKFVGLTIVCV